ncbi:ParB N-terminal domain-containing protein [Paracoccus sp. MC1854]|uniref:ParB/RepB/Spo0J family partition protein n=1 Tax=Paracoccus sp. MC1854 TaxID=2760306 RepID=UPI0015FEC0C8|nr:ParB N-terminal domain-containing protein [Paracoccus sp. MC1854]
MAQIAGEAAAQAALDDLADSMRQARDSGRLIIDLPLESVVETHLVRDRQHFDPEDMAALKASLADRGQQTPIEVVALGGERYGLISGARRLSALRELAAEQGGRFEQVQAVIRPFAEAPQAYLAMVEENEIRSDLSFYERARLAHEAARIGVFESPSAAVKALFVHASPSRRSKILNFVSLHERLGEVLRFPEAIPEKLGLALDRMLQQFPEAASELRRALSDAKAETVAEERRILEAALEREGQFVFSPRKHAEKPATPPVSREIVEGIRIKGQPGRVVLSGRGVTEELLDALSEWLRARQ